MAKNKVEIAGINTSSLRSLKHEEMVLLFKSLKKGDNESKRLLVEGNLKLVLSITSGNISISSILKSPY